MKSTVSSAVSFTGANRNIIAQLQHPSSAWFYTMDCKFVSKINVLDP